MVVGLWVGIATVGVFVHWYMVDYEGDGHTTVTFDQLRTWGQCQNWDDFKANDVFGIDLSEDPCKYFTHGKIKASTLSLTVLVVIEMLNALNALSEDGSLVTMPPWSNPYLLLAMLSSIGTHFMILYIPILATIFEIVPLTLMDWKIVMYWSMPVIFIDELLKLAGRIYNARHTTAKVSGLKED